MQSKFCCYYVSYEFHLVGVIASEYRLFLYLKLSEIRILILTLSCFFSSKILAVNFFLQWI